jgi:hypothetical protein
MPLAESSDDQAMIRGAGVKSGEHLPAPPLEACLKVTRAVRDLCRVGSGALGLFRGVGLYWPVTGRYLKDMLLREQR